MMTVLKLSGFPYPEDLKDREDYVSVTIQCIICQNGYDENALVKIEDLNDDVVRMQECVWDDINPDEELTKEQKETDVLYGNR